MQLTATPTGSTSIRLLWSPSQMPASAFTVYRGPDATFAHAAVVGGPLSLGAPWYNDYTAAPLTTYYYWLQDQNSVQVGPASATTIAATVNQDAVDEGQMNALATWAASVWGYLVPVVWRYQNIPAVRPPRITLNMLLIKDPGRTDSLDNMGEALRGGRIGTVSVLVTATPDPSSKELITVTGLTASTYTVTINGTPYSMVYSVAPANATQVVTDLANLMAATPNTINTLLYGSDPNNQALMVENFDPTLAFASAATGLLSQAAYTPPKALTIAQRLQASLGDQVQLDALSAAGISVGTKHGIQDLSGMLETGSQLQAQFDFLINVAQIYPVSGPIIDTAQAPSGIFN